MGRLGVIAVVLVVGCVRPVPTPVVETPTPAPVAEAPVVAPPPVAAEHAPALPDPPAYARPADWPDALIFPTTLDPKHAVATIGDHGDLRLEHTTHGSVAEVAKIWGDALGDAGFTPREPCTESEQHTCVWTGNDRIVTSSIASSWDGQGIDVTVHWLPKRHVAKVKLPGACVTPPVSQRVITVHAAGIDQEGEYRQAETRWDMTGHRSADLDGDGVGEMLVPHDSKGTCPWDVPHDVYVMRGACGHKVGTIVGQVDHATHLSKFTKGLRVIHTSASWADHGSKSPIPEHHTRERTFAFDGRRLKATSDETRSGRCHHCGVVRCTEG